MKNINTLLIIFASLIISGCGTNTPSKFYVLTAAEGDLIKNTQNVQEENLSIFIGPLSIPDYLERPQIISFKSSNEIYLDEFNRWAEPLDENIMRILRENISTMIPTNKVYIHSIFRPEETSFKIPILIEDFVMYADSTLIFKAKWGLTKNDEVNFLMTKKSFYSEKITGINYDGLAGAMSKMLGKFSNEISEAIKKEL